MAILRQYVMIAAEGQESSLRDALSELGRKVRSLEGCEGVELLRDPRDPTHFVFIEHWSSIESHKTAGRLLGKEALAQVLATIARPPEGRYLEPLGVG